MVNMPVYHLPKPRWGKLDDMAYNFCIGIASSKTLHEKPRKEKLK
jgi:hypothetical protein